MATESTLVKNLMLCASRLGGRLFRNNVGMAWAPAGGGGNIVRCAPGQRYKSVTICPGDVVVRNARPLHAGLCKGSSDLIGWTRVVVTDQMVGDTVAIFTASEAKGPHGRATKEQGNFIKAVNDNGGIAGVVRSEEDLVELMRQRM